MGKILISNKKELLYSKFVDKKGIPISVIWDKSKKNCVQVVSIIELELDVSEIN